MTLDTLFERAYECHWGQERFVKSGWADEVHRLYHRQLAGVFGHRDPQTITPGEVRAWHRSKSATPIDANRALEVLSRIYSLAFEFEWLEGGINPARGIRAHWEQRRRRRASAKEVAAIGAVLARDKTKTGIYIKTLLLTGARPISLQRVSWSELAVKGDIGILTYHGKSTEHTGDYETIILPAQALELLKQLKRRRDGLIFGPTAYTVKWNLVRNKAGCPDLWLRDFRRTFASLAISGGVGLSIVGELLNHHSTQTTKRYAWLDDAARVDAVRKVEEQVKQMWSGKHD